MLPVITIQLPLSLSSQMYMVCSWICRPTDTKIMKETDRVQSREVLLLRNRCEDRFFMVRSRSVACTQKKQIQATIRQKMYWMPKDKRMRPKSRLSMMMKNITSKLPSCQLINARGSRQQMIRPKPAAMSPKMSLAVGNSLPSIQVSILVASVLFLTGFRFSARSFFMTLQMGATAETIGTNTPISNPPIMESEVGVISYRQPKKSSKTEVTTLSATQARGYAHKFAKRTYLSDPARILAMMKALLAPITLSRAKSKFFFSTPMRNMLFIISTLSRNSEQMMSWNMTPMNIPMKPRFLRLPAIGIEVVTDINPILSIMFLQKLLSVMKVYSQLGLEQILILSSKLTVASVEKCARSNCQELMNLIRAEVCRSLPLRVQVQLSICCSAYLISRQTKLLTLPMPNLPDAVSNTSFTVNFPLRKFYPWVRVYSSSISCAFYADSANELLSQFLMALKMLRFRRTNLTS